MTKRRCGLSTHDLYLLNEVCQQIDEALGMPYLVGTAATDQDYRDVDVRVLLDDDEFDAIFAARPKLWDLLCFTVSHYLRDVTGLPVDFQVQRRTEANERFGGMFRNPLAMPRQFAGGGDATRFREHSDD